jgi:glycosyltransferase involved in cell wall biosynthesis
MIGLFTPPPLNPEKQTFSSRLVGAEIAAAQFCNAVLRYCTNEKIAIFVHESAILQVNSELQQILRAGSWKFSSVNIHAFSALPNVLADNVPKVLHNSLAPELHSLSHIRSRFASYCFPITCTPHGFGAASILWDYFARLAFTPLLPCDSVICTSRAAHQAFINCLEHVRNGFRCGCSHEPSCVPRVDLLPLGVDAETFAPHNKLESRRHLGLPSERILVLAFGRMNHLAKADLAPLLLAWSNLARKHSGRIGLIIAGAASPGEVTRLRQTAIELQCADSIFIRESPSVVEAPLYYAASDIFVGLSDTLQESFGLAPLEAMASGLPVVVSDWSGYRDTVLHGNVGFRVPTYWGECDALITPLSPLVPWQEDAAFLTQTVAVDVPKLQEYLDVLITNATLRQKMGSAARQHILANYSWEKVIPQYLALWNELDAIAHSLPPQSCRPSPLEPRFFANFGHFASAHITGNEVLNLTPRGKAACRQRQVRPPTPEAKALFDPAVSLQILLYLRMMSLFKQSAHVGDLCERLGTRRGLAREVLMAHILWLIKHDLVQVISA